MCAILIVGYVVCVVCEVWTNVIKTLFFDGTATTENYTYATLFPYTTLFRSSLTAAAGPCATPALADRRSGLARAGVDAGRPAGAFSRRAGPDQGAPGGLGELTGLAVSSGA